MKKIRNEYIKAVAKEKAAIDEQIKRETKNVLKDLLNETVKNEVKNLLSEAADDDYDEEEADAPIEAADVESMGDTEGADAVKDDAEDTDDEKSADDVESDEADDVWGDLEQYQGEDGEYDLTGMEGDGVIEVLKAMKPTDCVRVVKDEDGSVTMSNEDTGETYILELGDDEEFDDDIDDDEDIELEFDAIEQEHDDDESDDDFDDDEEDDIEDDSDDFVVDTDDVSDMVESILNEYNVDLGCTVDNYQNRDSAMTTPNNNEPSKEGTETYSMDGGVPKGTEKPFAGKVEDKEPFQEEVNEGCDGMKCNGAECKDGECKISEGANVGGFVQQNSTSKTYGPNTSGRNGKRAPRNGSIAGRKVKKTTDPRYAVEGEVDEAILAKANAIFNENKKLRSLASKLHKQLNEASVQFNSLAKIVKLITENTTTRDEKVNIVRRFNEVKSINEGVELYNIINKELKTVHTQQDINKMMNPQVVNESVNKHIETPIYKSEDLSSVLNLMERIDRV